MFFLPSLQNFYRANMRSMFGLVAWAGLSITGLTWGATVPGADTVTIVRHAPSINGGKVEGSVRLLTGENVMLQGTAVITSDLIVPGTPIVQKNGNPIFGGVVVGTGSTSPSGYQISLSGQSSLGHVDTRFDPIALSAVAPPPACTGSVDAYLTQANQHVSNFSRLRNLSLSGQAGAVNVPPGTYGDFSACDHTTFVLGVANATQPSVYNLASLTLNGANLNIVGPVKIVLGRSLSLNGSGIAGTSAHVSWLTLACAKQDSGREGDGGDEHGNDAHGDSKKHGDDDKHGDGEGDGHGDDETHGGCSRGSIKIDGGSTLYALICAPDCSVTITGNAAVTGFVTCNRLAVNGNGVLHGLIDHAPTVNAGTVQTITLPVNSAALHGVVSDDGLPPCSTLTVTWTKISGPGTVSFANANLAATTATFGAVGIYVLRLSANDSLLSASADVTITVNSSGAVNHPPVVNAGLDKVITLPLNNVTLTGVATDDGLPNPPGALTYTWSKITGTGNVTFGSASSASTTATFSQGGVFTLRLTASDSQLSASDDVVVTVNQSPVVSAGTNQTIQLPASAALLGSATDDGLPNPPSALTVAWSKVSGPGSVTFSNGSIAATQATFSQAGTYVLQLSANDSTGSVTSNVTITVQQQNQAPVANAGANQTIALPATASLTGSATDDGFPNPPGALTYTWSKTSGPGSVTFGNASAAATTASFSQAGAYVLQLKASDSLLNSTSNVTITVQPQNQAPVANAGNNQTISLPASATLSGSATDDGLPNPPGTLTYAWSKISGPGTITFGNATAAATTASFSQAGTYVLQLKASDSLLNSTSNLTITVQPQNQAPVANAGANQTISLPSSATLSGSATDDGLPNPPATLTYVWSKASGPGTVTFGNATAAATTATFGQSGTYVLTLTASDSALNGTSTVTITVQPQNQAPVANAGANQTISLPSSTTLNGSATDDGLPNPPGALTYTWSKISGPGNATFGNANSATTTTSFSQAGTYVLQFSASDSVLSGTSTITIIVQPQNQAPIANAGSNQIIALPASATLSGSGTDDGYPNPPGALTYVWSKVSGPGAVTFGNASAAATTASFSQAGAYVLKLTANDSVLTGSSNVTVTVQPVNQAPVANAGANQTIQLPSSASLNGSATDDGYPNPPGTLTYAWSKASGPGTVTFGNTSAAVTTVSFSQAGTYILTLAANDSILNGTSNVTITVQPQNQAPIVNAGNNQTIALPATATLAGVATDDGYPNPPGILTYAWSRVSGPGAVTFGNANAAATTASFSQAGTYVLQLTANDSALSGTSNVTIIVQPVNQAPVANAGLNQTIQLPSTASLNGSATDDGYPNPPGALTYNWSKVSGPGTVSFSNATSTATTASFSLAGTYVLTFAASDSVLTGTSNVTVVVQPQNQAPVTNAGNNQTIVLPTSATLSGSATDDGYPNPPGVLTYVWSKTSGPGTVTFVNANVATTTASFSQAGTYVLTLKSSDSILSSTSNVTITVQPQNQAPIANSGTNQTIQLPAMASLTGSATDDGYPNPPGALTYAWSKVSGPGTVSFTNSTSAATTANFSQTGTYVLSLTASDSLLTGSSNVTITVLPINQAPVVNAGPNQSVQLPGNASLNGSATDDGYPNPPGALTYTWSKASGPGTVTFGNASAAATTATFGQAGTYVLSLTANDSILTGSSNVTVTVQPVNQAPVANAGGNQTIQLPSSVSLTGSASDDGYPNPPGVLTYSWTKVSGPAAVTFANATALVTTASFGQAGTYVLSLTASDSLLTGSSNVTISVLPVNQAPVANAGANQTIQLPSSASLNGSATDDGYPNPPGTLTYSWSKVSGPGTVTFANASAVVTTANFSVAGTYVLSLTASDSLQTGSSNVTVGVLPANKAPVVSAGRDRAIALPNPLVLSGTVADDGLPAGAALTVAWSKVSGPGNATFANAADPATSVSFDAPGTYGIRLTASDTEFTSTANATIVVLPATNQPPHVNAGAPQSIALGASAVLSATATDDGLPNPPGAMTYVWSKIKGPGTVIFDNANVLSTTAAFSSAGEYTLRLSASDSLLSGSGDLTVTVGAGNQAPTVSAGPDQSIVLPNNAVTLNGVAFDDGLPNPPGALTITWSKVSGPGNVTFGDPAKAITTAAFDQPGPYVLRLSANDSVLSSSANVTIAVRQTNQAPVVNAGPDQFLSMPGLGDIDPSFKPVLFASNPNEFGFQFVLYYPPENNLITSLGEFRNTLIETFDANGVQTPKFLQPGAIKLTVVPDDGGGKSLGGFTAGDLFMPLTTGTIARYDSATHTVQSAWATIPGLPYASAVAIDSTGIFGGDMLMVTANGDVWRINSAGTPTHLAQPGGPGNYEGILIVPNDTNLYGPLAGKLLVTFESGLQYPIPCIDAQGNVSYYSLGVIPEHMAIIPKNQDFFGTDADGNVWTVPAAAFAGNEGEIIMSFGDEGSLSHVRWDGTQFKISAYPPLIVWEMTAFAPKSFKPTPPPSVTLAGSVSDDGQPNPPGAVTTLWSKSSGPGDALFTDPTKLNTAVTFTQGGIYVLALTADDGELKSSSAVTIYVNQAPVINAGPNQTIELPSPAQLNGSIIDDGLPNPPGAVSSGWTKASGPDKVTFSAPAYDVANDFSLAANPNSTWSYGWTANPIAPGWTFAPFTQSQSNLNVTGYQAWGIPAGYNSVAEPPLVLLNPTDAYYDVTNGALPPHTIALYPWVNQISVVRWTAPAAGTYAIQGQFQGLAYTNTDVTILLNATTSLFSANVLPNMPTQPNASPFSFSKTLAAGDTLDFTAVSRNQNEVVNAETLLSVTILPPGNAQSATATFSAPGTYVLRLTASDSQLSSSAYTTVVVQPVNKAPWVDAGPDQTVTLPSATQPALVSLSAAVKDDGYPVGAAITSSWSKVSGPGNVAFADATSPVTTATFDAPGQYLLRISASDTLLTDSNDIAITVLQQNRTLTVSADYDHAAVFPNAFALTGVVASTGTPAGVPITTGWIKIAGPGSALFANSNVINTSVTFSAVGTYQLRLTASDGIGLSSADVSIAVNYANKVPTVYAGTSQTLLPSANSAALTGFAEDDGLPNPPAALTYAWSQVSGPSSATLNPPNAPLTQATFSAPGTYVLRLTVSDTLLNGSGDVTLVVPTPNAIVPVVSVNTATPTVTLPAALSLTGTASEAANPNAIFTYSWSSVYGPGTATFNPPDAVATQAAFSIPGKYVVHFTATDGTNSNSADVVVTAISSYSPPSLSAGFDTAVTLPNTLQLGGYITSGGSLPLQSLTWSSVAGPGTVTFSNPTTTGSIYAITSATFSAPGLYILRLTAMDAGAGASSDVTITVMPIPTPPPVPDAGFDRTVFVGQFFQIKGVAPAGTSSYWSYFTYNGTPNFPFILAYITPPGQLSLTLLAEGTYIFRFNARDNSTGLESFKDVTINCLPDAAPVVNAGSTVYTTLQPPTPLHGSVTFSNPTLGDPQITWSKVYGPDVTFSNPHTADTVATFSGNGQCRLMLSAYDGVYSAYSLVDVNISVTNNLPPVVNAGPPQTITLPQSVALTGTATDDGLPQGTLEILWHKISGPASVAFADAASPATTASFSAPGTYILRLSADDANLVSNSDTTVTVLAQNQAPVVSAGPNQIVAANAPLTLNGSASDDGMPNPPGALTVNWIKLSGPGNAVFTSRFRCFIRYIRHTGLVHAANFR